MDLYKFNVIKKKFNKVRELYNNKNILTNSIYKYIINSLNINIDIKYNIYNEYIKLQYKNFNKLYLININNNLLYLLNNKYIITYNNINYKLLFQKYFYENKWDIIEKLIIFEECINLIEYNFLVQVIRYNRIEIIKYILLHDKSLNILLKKSEYMNYNILHFICSDKYINKNIIYLFINYNKLNELLLDKNNNGDTPLHCVFSFNNTLMLNNLKLINNINNYLLIQNNNNNNCYHYLFSYCSLYYIKQFLNYNYLNIQNSEGNTCLHLYIILNNKNNILINNLNLNNNILKIRNNNNLSIKDLINNK